MTFMRVDSLKNYPGPCKVLLTDLDGTMTSDGGLQPEIYESLFRLRDKGIRIVVVTGRPAGWGHAFASLWPVDAVVTENGGVTFIKRRHRVEKMVGVDELELPRWRAKMVDALSRLKKEIPELQLSTDSQYREVDLAIDWNEDIKVPMEKADDMVAFLLKEGFVASRSSVHVNFSPPGFNKYTASMKVIEALYSTMREQPHAFLYVGDSLNDVPMFEGFDHTVGVANIKKWWSKMKVKPRYMTESEEGAGFLELIAHLILVL